MMNDSTFIRNLTANFYGCNFLESQGKVSSLDLLGLVAITRLVHYLCGNHGQNSSHAGNLLCGFADLW
jgi:hypothetical protein